MSNNNVNIRLFEAKDIPDLIEMGKSFYDYAKFSQHGLSFNVDNLRDLLQAMLDNTDVFVCLVVDINGKIEGTICGVITPWILNTDQKILTEIWWWLNYDVRGRGIDKILLNNFEKIGKEKGCANVMMVALENEYKKVFDRYYRQNKYLPMEYYHIRRL